MEIAGISVVVLETARAVSIRAEIELATLVKERPDALVSFAAGETFRAFFAEIEKDVANHRHDLSRLRVTHLDEFLNYAPETSGGFVHELLACAPLGAAFEDGRFHAVPSSGIESDLRAHEAKLAELGGVDLQFVGIGGNGHVAYAEPGTLLDLGFHRARLAASTRTVLEPRFAPGPAPEEAVTAGPASILSAERLVLVATGSAKAKAVRDMMEGDIGPACPASVLRRHPDALVLLDSAAAKGLDWPELELAGGR